MNSALLCSLGELSIFFECMFHAFIFKLWLTCMKLTE